MHNGSGRPISVVTCKVMSTFDRHSLASPTGCGVVEQVAPAWLFQEEPKLLRRLENLLPSSRGGFAFPGLQWEPDQIVVAWFTDDAGFRWQLDENLHLVLADDETEYLAYRSQAA